MAKMRSWEPRPYVLTGSQETPLSDKLMSVRATKSCTSFGILADRCGHPRRCFVLPLHDWTDREGWEGVHHLWITELLWWIKPRLPTGYRTYIGVAPTLAISYRVGERAATGGRILAIWRRPLAVGKPLPLLPLPITLEVTVTVDLETTYARAAADAYLP